MYVVRVACCSMGWRSETGKMVQGTLCVNFTSRNNIVCLCSKINTLTDKKMNFILSILFHSVWRYIKFIHISEQTKSKASDHHQTDICIYTLRIVRTYVRIDKYNSECKPTLHSIIVLDFHFNNNKKLNYTNFLFKIPVTFQLLPHFYAPLTLHS